MTKPAAINTTPAITYRVERYPIPAPIPPSKPVDQRIQVNQDVEERLTGAIDCWQLKQYRSLNNVS
jgi:hypothetical protein